MRKLNFDDLVWTGRRCASNNCASNDPHDGSICDLLEYEDCIGKLLTLLCDALENKQLEIDALHRILDSLKSEESAI